MLGLVRIDHGWRFSTRILQVWLLGIAVCVNGEVRAVEPPDDLQPIGGRWYVRPGDPPVYVFRDADRFVDLFSYHAKDSNADGIANLRLSHTRRHLVIQSQGYPNHPTAVFPNSENPNEIRVQQFTFRFPLEPRLSGNVIRLPMGPVGMALNGVVFFNPFEFGGMNAVEGYSEVWLDSCCGHPQQTGVYHYHKYPSCVKSPFPDDGRGHSPIVGFAWDGFPVYGPYDGNGKMAKDLTGDRALDVCNGHEDRERGYHYHVTPGRFPYIFGGYTGIVEVSNNPGLARTGKGALEDRTRRGSRLGHVITAVKPGTASRGKTLRLTFDLEPENARRRLPDVAPHWVQVGPYEAHAITRSEDRVTAEITIPKDASLGVVLDCHLEFGRETNPFVIKKNDVFRVVE